MALINLCISNQIHVLALVHKNSSRLQYLPKSKYLSIKEVDLNEYKDFQSELSYDVFFHFAWDGTFGASRNDTFLQNKNIQFTLDAVKMASRLKCHTFIGAGSQAEYGKSKKKLNSITPVFPESGYGIAKLCAGQLSRISALQLGIDHIWLRILSVYGPYDNPETMVMKTINSFLKGKEMKFTKGEQIWDYLYSEDAANAILHLSKHGLNGHIYTLGSGIPHKLAYFIKEIWKESHSKLPLKIGELPYSENQVMYLCADIRDLKMIGFYPLTTFSQGIKKTIKWFKDYNLLS
jgi:nucleoside-diphosphate-sugar epimerase